MVGRFPWRVPVGFGRACCRLLVAMGVGLAAGLLPSVGVAQSTADEGFDKFEALNLTSKAFRIAAEKIRPTLVTIESFGGVSAVQGRIGGIRKQGEGNTTGVMISPDGYVITSTFNFIQRPPLITVITGDGQRRVATLLGRDDIRKLCLLKIEKVKEMPVPEMVDPDNVVVGQWALSLGVGYGDTNPALSMGIISAKNRVGGRAIQTDANTSPANYGGPLIDLEGRIIGICVPLNPQSQAVGAGVEWYDSGIGFAISLFGKEDWLDRMKNGERIYPAFLGIQAVPKQGGDGVLIEKVVPKSPAEEAGLKRGQRITALDGKPINDMMKLKQVLNRFEAGQEVKIVVVTEPDTDLSDDEVAKRKANGEPLVDEQVTRELTLVLGQPPVPKDAPPQLEPPKIR